MEDFYGVPDPYGTYETKGSEGPYEILLKMKAWNNEIRSTISKVNDSLGQLHEQQTQILQNIDSIELNVLDIVSNASGQQTQISQLLLEVGQVKINVTNVDSRLGSAEGTLIVQSNAIASRVKLTDFTGATISSLIVQDAYSINLLANSLNLSGFVTFSALQNAGQTTINGSNITTGQILANLIYGQVFVVGNGTSTQMVLTSVAGSHRIYSYDAAGFRIESQANLSLQGNAGTVYSNSKFWALAGLQVTGSAEFQNLSTTGTITATTFQRFNGQPLVDSLYVSNALSGYATTSALNSGLAQKETDLKVWCRNTFVAK